MRRYLALARGSFMVGVVYRFGFFFTIAGNLVYMGIAYYLWRSIYKSTETIRDLTFNEAFLYVALGSAVFVLLKTYTDWYLAYEIREGAIATVLIKPLDLQLYTLFFSLGSMLMNLAAITVPTVFVLIWIFKVQFVLGPGLLLFPLSLFLAYLVSFCFDYFVGLLAFYTESGWGLSISKEILLTVLSGALIPLQFFPDQLRDILLKLPFQTIYHTPLMMVTRPNQSWETLGSMLLVQVIWVAVLFLFTRLFYSQAIKVIRISGG